ncbi:hypothetical protein like AT3G47510 [Hibiscus trionum]|uniref:Uncharacterized protein n=1 Tax=Hibiscus trionum TaxID=183268 RepID=A0A9W7HGH2_HIBTR|nr:hypothetical protein like AT3G47510 [Hibiscus trionum]
MERALFRLLVVLLGFSHIISLNAVPLTRIEILVHGPQVPEIPHPIYAEKSSKEEMVNGKMLMELNDYPGSGANNRHTPRPQFGRCVDC